MQNAIEERRIVAKYFQKWQEKTQQKSKLTSDGINRFVDDLIAKRSRKVRSEEVKSANSSEQYANRYKAQRDIILMQKSKILEQEQRIHELQYGKICEQLKTSYQNQKSAIKKILTKLTTRTKIVAGVRIVPEPEEIQMKINKVPKTQWKMEERAREREIRRQIIQERKRIIEEEKQRLYEEQLEKKRALDEEEKKRQLEAIKERRKHQVNEERRRQERKMQFFENMRIADAFYRKTLKRNVVKRLQSLLKIRDDQFHLSEMFYETILLRKCLLEWRAAVQNSNLMKMVKATYFYERKLKEKYYKGFILIRQISMQNMHVAMDYYDYQVQCKVFCQFYIIVNLIKTRRQQHLRVAQRHFNSKLLVQCFYQWKSLPVILQLERAKEVRKRKWRERVLKILPDYKPQLLDS